MVHHRALENLAETRRIGGGEGLRQRHDGSGIACQRRAVLHEAGGEAREGSGIAANEIRTARGDPLHQRPELRRRDLVGREVLGAFSDHQPVGERVEPPGRLDPLVEVRGARDGDPCVPDRDPRPPEPEAIRSAEHGEDRAVPVELERQAGRTRGHHRLSPALRQILGGGPRGKARPQLGLGGDRHPSKIGRRLDVPRIDAGEQLAVVGNVMRGMREE
jgi:hypothetical protein